MTVCVSLLVKKRWPRLEGLETVWVSVLLSLICPSLEQDRGRGSGGGGALVSVWVSVSEDSVLMLKLECLRMLPRDM